MRHATYDKQAVINDIADQKISPAEISLKYGITTGNVYTIKAAAVRAGIINSRGYKTIDERMKDEKSVLTPKIRERIKNLRDEDMTTTEITIIFNKEGMKVDRNDVEKVMARGADAYFTNKPSRGKRVKKV